MAVASRLNANDPSGPSGWERHLQTIIAGVILAGILWSAKAITGVSVDMGVLINRISNLESSIAAMDERFERYQTKSEALFQLENQRLRDQILESRIKGLEERVRNSD